MNYFLLLCYLRLLCFLSKAQLPIAVLQAPVVLEPRAATPKALLKLPSVLASSAAEPTATYYSLWC
jgi:hypothetical protein